MCMSGCPTKVYYNWSTGKAENAFSAIRVSRCSPACRRYVPNLGLAESATWVMLYDADKIKDLASTPNEGDPYGSSAL